MAVLKVKGARRLIRIVDMTGARFARPDLDGELKRRRKYVRRKSVPIAPSVMVDGWLRPE